MNIVLCLYAHYVMPVFTHIEFMYIDILPKRLTLHGFL